VTAPRGTDLQSASRTGEHAEQVAAIREKLASGEYKGRTRPLAEIEAKLDAAGTTLGGAIEEQLAARRPIAVVEIGFGWGPALIELAWRFRDEPVTFAGINLERKPPVERPEDLAAIAEALDIVPAERIGEFRPPEVHFYDASSLHFADDSVDFVYSAITFRFIPDKVRAIEEVARVLRPGGRAILDLGERDWEYPGGPASDPVLLTDRPSYLVVHHDLELVPVQDWFAFAGGERFTARMPTGRRCVLDLTKHAPGRLESGLALDPERTMPMRDFAKAAGTKLRGKRAVRSAYAIAPERMAAFTAR
jgi:SAM-dependent methyltransferase